MNPKKKFSIIVSSVLAFIGIASFSAYVFMSPFMADEYPILATTIKLPVNNERFVYTDTPLIQGKSTTGNVINIFDNENQIGSAISDASGNFYFKPSTPFTTGIHTIEAKNNTNSSDHSNINILVDTSDQSKAILRAQNTSIIENDHKYFGNGANQYDAIVKMMGNPAQVESDFAKAEKAGIKMIRVINYMLDDMALPDPTTSPVATVSDGGSLASGNYIYRYTCVNLSKTRFAYTPAETLPSAVTNSIGVADNQKVSLTLAPCAKSYRYYIYRRLAAEDVDSEKYLGEVSSVAGTTATYVDNGTVAVTPAHTLPISNQTRNNPRTRWTTDQSSAYMTGFGNWNETALLAADKVMVLAKKYNIRIMFTFLDQHDNNTGGVMEIARNCAVTNPNYFSDDCSKNITKEVISKFVDRTNTQTNMAYKNDPAIFAWEFINEPWDTNGGYGLRSWIEEMGIFLKNIDPNHMLSSGDDGSVWFTHNYEPAYNANNKHDFVTSGLPSVVDLLTWHGYPERKPDEDPFTFNHGHYSEFDPDRDLPEAEATEWKDRWGEVKATKDSWLSIDGAIKELQRRSHYAYFLNKPVVFGEWGVNWATVGKSEWITSLSNAILTAKPDLVKEKNAFLGGNFDRPEDLDWKSATTNIAQIDTEQTYNNHPSLKISPIANSTSTTSTKFVIKPNTKYWYEFVIKKPNSKFLRIRLNTYKDGVSVPNTITGPYFDANSSEWITYTRLNMMFCEFTTPDANEMEFSFNLESGAAGEDFWIGQIRLYELVTPTVEDIGSTFASTGWWALPDDNGLLNSENSEALKTAAVNFANASMANLSSLVVTEPDPEPDPTDPTSNPTPTPIDTTNYLILPVARFSSSWNMVSFPDTSGAVTDDSLIPSGLRLRRYDTASNSYKKGETNLIELRPGQGYWLNIDDINKINGLKYPLTSLSSTEIAVTKGWNLLGNPYQTDLPLSNLKVKYKDGSIRSYSDAIVRREVAGYAWSYEGSEKKYYFIAINPNNYKTDSPKNTVIKPFRGFWTIIKSDKVSSVIMNK